MSRGALRRVARVVAWLLLAVAVVLGLLGVVLAVTYLMGGSYVPARTNAGFGLLAGCVAFGVAIGMRVSTSTVGKIGSGVIATVLTYVISSFLASMARQLAGRGGPGGAAEDLTYGLVALVLGAIVIFWLRQRSPE
jgi:hypothetical protein